MKKSFSISFPGLSFNSSFDLSTQASAPHTASPVQSSSWLQRIQQFLAQYLLAKPELKAWRTVDRTGQVFWHVHDPLQNISKCFDSEAKAAAWIEKRYYTP
jgi:hypothetical protein